MSDFVVLHMWEPFRQSLIEAHSFYVEQAQKRLLSQFNNIGDDADQAAEEWLGKRGQNFDPGRDDPSSIYEAAYEVGIEFYGMLNDMREQTRLGVVAGMFHEWDKRLRDWLVREILHWHRGEGAVSKVWSADFGQIGDLLESFGWKLRNTDYFRTLDTCRLVVNAYKHGEGKSLDELRKKFPEYFGDSPQGSSGTFSDTRFFDYSSLKVSDPQFQAFSEAILTFWREVPESVLASQVTDLPDWFDKAIQKDRTEHEQAIKT
jgi:hypothetical protein